MMKRTALWGVVAVAALALVGTGGCGSSSSSSPGISTGDRVTRATEGNFTQSARILAAREAAASGDTWLSADAARQFDADLAAIRAAYPAIKSIGAIPDYDLHRVLVAVRAGTSWSGNWDAGNAATGEAKLDAVLTEFAPEQIVPLTKSAPGAVGIYTLKFGQSLNMPKLAQRIKDASDSVSSATPNLTAGDGNNIAYMKSGTDATRRYTFSQGWGDCPAGCISRHSWEFVVSGDGKTVTLDKESGAALDTAPPL